MMIPKFIRFRGDIINITTIIDVCYDSERQKTAICYNISAARWSKYNGDCRDEIWDLIKLAMELKNEVD